MCGETGKGYLGLQVSLYIIHFYLELRVLELHTVDHSTVMLRYAHDPLAVELDH